MTATAPIDQQGSPLLDQLEQDDFFGRWETAWNTHDLDLLETLVAEDIVCNDPAMFSQIGLMG